MLSLSGDAARFGGSAVQEAQRERVPRLRPSAFGSPPFSELRSLSEPTKGAWRGRDEELHQAPAVARVKLGEIAPATHDARSGEPAHLPAWIVFVVMLLELV